MPNRDPRDTDISPSTIIVLRPPVKLFSKKSQKSFVFSKGYPVNILPNKYQKLQSYGKEDNVHQNTFKYDGDYPDFDNVFDFKRLVFSMIGNVCGKSRECHGK